MELSFYEETFTRCEQKLSASMCENFHGARRENLRDDLKSRQNGLSTQQVNGTRVATIESGSAEGLESFLEYRSDL